MFHMILLHRKSLARLFYSVTDILKFNHNFESLAWSKRPQKKKTLLKYRRIALPKDLSR